MPVFSRAPLAPVPFAFLPLGSVRPEGWLLDQMRLQADGLTGRLEEIWPDVGPDSGWLGGRGESWERGPYYLDGLVPLAYQLGDARLIGMTRKWVEWTLGSQREDGFFGPAGNPDWWPRMVMAKVLLQVFEATGDDRILPFLDRYFRYQLSRIEERPLAMWAAARGGENVAVVLDLFDRTGEPYLLRLAGILRAQTTDWTSHFLAFPFEKPAGQYLNAPLFRAFRRLLALKENLPGSHGIVSGDRPQSAERIRRANESHNQRTYHLTHGVNNAMAVRAPATFHRLTKDPRDLEASARGLDELFEHHGTEAGVFTGDEHLAGTDPTQGIELCTVVELMRSLEDLVRLTGEGRYGDLLEKAAYNALPAALMPDMTRHQYFQQVNQVLVTRASRRWFYGHRDANLFGLSPNYGCCTANLHQGWPRLCASLFFATEDGGLAAAAYAPCRVRTTVGEGIHVELVVRTEYPFRDFVDLSIALPERGEARFPLKLRIPAWAEAWEIRVNGAPADAACAGGFATLDRVWRDGDRVLLTLPMPPRTVEHPDGSVSVERGPLLFALRIAEETRLSGGPAALPDLEVRPASPWNYALVPDDCAVELRERDAVPFRHDRPPIVLKARGVRIPSWRVEHGSAGPVPRPAPGRCDACGVLEPLELVPYGSTALRIARFPRA